MNKYTFVVLGRQREDFLRSLQELGMVDVTTAGWEPSDEDRRLMSGVDSHREASEHLRNLLKTDGFTAGEPYATGAEAFEKYSVARKEVAQLESEVARYEKLAADVRPWGGYDPAVLAKLAEQGVVMRYFTAYASDFAKKSAEWAEGRILQEVNTVKGLTYFAVVTTPEDEVHIDAQEVKLPQESLPAIEKRIGELKKEIEGWQGVFARAAATVDDIEAEGEGLKERLQFRQAAVSGDEAAEGALVVMEAWAREKQEKEVDAMLEEYPDVIFIKEKPRMEDNTPVELKNRKVVAPFEFIAEMYALPRYGTMDLTRYFAPFYMLFFGFCLADAGYGLLILLGGIFLALKGKGAMQAIGKLSIYCGASAVVFGFFASSFFGIDIKSWSMFAGHQNMFFTSNGLFGLAIGLGVFQILFGMVLKVITTTRAFGFRYALSTIGWIITLLTAIAGIGLPMIGIEGFAAGSLPFWICLGIGLFMMLFLNNPGKNPLVNFGGGLWNTYNDITGFLSDALSYIRLFAIGLSGGVLAQVFNDLAFGLSPDIPVVGQIVTLIILLIGHGLNLFMSTLSSMVHPLRLTFVEFYKNAGFEATSREFTPLKHTRKAKN